MIVGNEKTIRFGQFFCTKCRRKDLCAHENIKEIIWDQLKFSDFDVYAEHKREDEDSSYRYDIVGLKQGEVWIVEVKSELDIRNFGQIEAYILQARKDYPNSKVWLGTDCRKYWNLIEGEIGLMVQELMKRKKLGIILINPEMIWVLPTHNDLLNIEERGHLCEKCKYCDGLTMTGVGRKILISVEQGSKKAPKITNADREILYDYTLEDFKNIKKEFLEIKKKMGKNEFENRSGIKLES